MPKEGSVQPTDIWAASARTLTALPLHDLLNYPLPTSAYPITNVYSSAIANTFGSWTELVADVGSGKQLRGIIMTMVSAWQNSHEIEIGVGAAPGEMAIYRFTRRDFLRTDAGWLQSFYVPIEILLADNVRLSCRIRMDFSNVSQIYISPIIV